GPTLSNRLFGSWCTIAELVRVAGARRLCTGAHGNFPCAPDSVSLALPVNGYLPPTTWPRSGGAIFARCRRARGAPHQILPIVHIAAMKGQGGAPHCRHSGRQVSRRIPFSDGLEFLRLQDFAAFACEIGIAARRSHGARCQGGGGASPASLRFRS